jgi:RES domain-containing protein
MASVQMVDLSTVLHRASSLQYHKKAISPAGARFAAGRFNRKGVSALYVSTEPETA